MGKEAVVVSDRAYQIKAFYHIKKTNNFILEILILCVVNFILSPPS
jgi:hypothetical protein